MSYAPVPQVDSQPETGHARELVHPGSEADDVHGCAINGGSTLQSWTSPVKVHQSGHKDFATFSAVPVRENVDGEGPVDPSFLHYMAAAMSLSASSCAAFGVPKVMAFSIPGWLYSLRMSRTTLSACISIANLAGALTQPFIGRLVDASGPRLALSGMLALCSVAFTAPSFAARMDSATLRFIVMLCAIYGIRSLQAGIDTAGNVLVNHWFLKLRGRISSVRQVLMLSVQDLVLVQIVQGMDNWRATCWLSAAVAVFGMCLMLAGVTDTPEEVGLKPDAGRQEQIDASVSDQPRAGGGGAAGDSRRDASLKKGAAGAGGASFTVREAMSTSSFWILLFNNVLYSSIGVCVCVCVCVCVYVCVCIYVCIYVRYVDI